MRRRLLVTVLAVAAMASACSSDGAGDVAGDSESEAPPSPPKPVERSLEAGGRPRTYRVHRPADLRDDEAPLVIMLHGGFGSGQQAQEAYGWDAKADAEGFVVAYPDGVDRSWNAGTCCGRAKDENVDDVAFIETLISTVAKDERIDEGRVYATGLSNGGMLAHRLGCELPGRLAAIAPVAATLTVECSPGTPTSVIAVHGLDDQSVLFAGGVGPKAVSKDSRPSVPAAIETWRRIDGCGAPTTTQAGPVRTETVECRDGTAVELVTIEGAGHQWPGGKPPRPEAQRLLNLDQPSTAIDATARIWGFFVAHPRGGQ